MNPNKSKRDFSISVRISRLVEPIFLTTLSWMGSGAVCSRSIWNGYVESLTTVWSAQSNAHLKDKPINYWSGKESYSVNLPLSCLQLKNLRSSSDWIWYQAKHIQSSSPKASWQKLRQLQQKNKKFWRKGCKQASIQDSGLRLALFPRFKHLANVSSLTEAFDSSRKRLASASSVSRYHNICSRNRQYNQIQSVQGLHV